MTKEEIIQGLYKGDSRAIKEAIKALEQQTDDCVSRQAMLDAITEIDGNINMDIYTDEVREIIKELPLVTITHGTCKDCSHYDPLTCNSGTCLNPNMQWSNEVSATHYCADFEKVR